MTRPSLFPGIQMHRACVCALTLFLPLSLLRSAYASESDPSRVIVTDANDQAACPVRITVLDPSDIEPDVEVVVQRWAIASCWNDATFGRACFQTPLPIEIGEGIRVRFRSVDVAHALAFPACGVEVRLPATDDINAASAATVDVLIEGLHEGEVRSRCLAECGAEPDSFTTGISVGSSTTRAEATAALHRPPDGMTTVQWGADIAQRAGCLACHSLDGSPRTGPSLGGVAGTSRSLTDGRIVVADREYLRRSFLTPNDEVVAGYPPVSPSFEAYLNFAEVDALLHWLESL